MATTATPAKLKDGSWGARVPGLAKVGDVVTITTRAGKTWQATVEKILWTGDGISLCVTESSKGGGETGSRSRGRSGCAECGRGGSLVEDLEDGLMKHYRCCDIPPSSY